MTTGQKVAVWIFWIWTAVVVVATVWGVINYLTPRQYSGSEVQFKTGSDWDMEVDTNSPARITAVDSEYFHLVQGEKHLFGTPKTPPLGYNHDQYFVLDDQIPNGSWKIVKGSSTSYKLTADEPIDVKLIPTALTTGVVIFIGALLGLIVWFVGVIIGVVVTK